MRFAGRLTLLIGTIVAMLVAVDGLAQTAPPPWMVIARSHTTPGMSVPPGIHLNMPVSVVNGHRRPEALAVRLYSWKQERYWRGEVSVLVTCGSWRHIEKFEAKTPFIRQIAFRTWRARRCVIDAGSMVPGGSDSTLQILCRARPRSACAPQR